MAQIQDAGVPSPVVVRHRVGGRDRRRDTSAGSHALDCAVECAGTGSDRRFGCDTHLSEDILPLGVSQA